MKLSTKRLCRAGIIAALYALCTYAFAPLAFGPFQLRPAEAFCLLALLYPEAIPALFIGCALSNLASPYAFYDVLIGSTVTLISTFIAYLVGGKIKNTPLSIFVGGLFPVILNAAILPLVLVFLYGEITTTAFAAYCTFAFSILITQSLSVYALGAPLYLAVARLRKKGLRFLCD